MKRLIITIGLFLWALSPSVYSQNWTREQLDVFETVKSGWTLWSEALEKKDLNIWVDDFKPLDDFSGWWTPDGLLWDLADLDIFSNIYFKTVKATALESISPVSIRIYDDTALIYFYVIYHNQDFSGDWTRYEEKRFEVYIKDGGNWRWAGCMATGDETVKLK